MLTDRPYDMAEVDRPRAVVPLAHQVLERGHPSPEVGQRLGVGRVRHRHLVVEAVLVGVEARLQVEDRLAVLDGHDATRGERPSVANAVDLVQDRRVRIAGPQEVRVQRVDEAGRTIVGRVLDGSSCGDESLAGDLATEHALTLLVG
jgi:hypothetical protein